MNGWGRYGWGTSAWGQSLDVLTADSLQGDTQASTPGITQSHSLTAIDLQAGTTATTPAAFSDSQAELQADSLQAGSRLISPRITTDSQDELYARRLQTGSRLATPTLTTQYHLTANSLQSGNTRQPSPRNTDTFLVQATESYRVNMAGMSLKAATGTLDVQVKMTAIKANEHQATIDIEQELQYA